MSEAGLTAEQKLYFEDHVSLDGGYQIGNRMIASKCNATAIFAVADVMAIGIMKALLENGKRIPEDYSIIGFDGIKFGQYITPSLTTIRQDIVKKGMVAAEMVLYDPIHQTRNNDSVVLQPELEIRKSVMKIV
jgi:LacI family transcriptional regulator